MISINWILFFSFLSVLSFILYKVVYFFQERNLFLFKVSNFRGKEYLYYASTIIVVLLVFHKIDFFDILLILGALYIYENRKVSIFNNGILIGLNFIKWEHFHYVEIKNSELQLVLLNSILHKRVYNISMTPKEITKFKEILGKKESVFTSQKV